MADLWGQGGKGDKKMISTHASSPKEFSWLGGGHED